jgi:HPt (histidine-containing phosphotransfer) domain-containing protein
MTERCPQRISDIAHSLKGSVRYFLAEQAYDSAQHLELISSSGQRSQIDSACNALLREIDKLRHELLTLTK